MTRLFALALCVLITLVLGCRPLLLVASIDRSATAALALADAADQSAAGMNRADGTGGVVRAESAPAFSGSGALQHVQALAVGIGSRVAGSPAQSSTQQYLMDQYRQLGYQVALQPFTITAYQDRGSTVAISGALGQPVQANTIQYSAGGAAEAELVEAGLGRAEDFDDAGVNGKVVLVTRGDTRFNDKVSA